MRVRVCVSAVRSAVGSLFTVDVGSLSHVDSLGSKPSTKTCAICTLGVSLIEQYAHDNQLNMTQSADRWCQDATAEMPNLVGVCEMMVAPVMGSLEADFLNNVSPDVSCRTTLNACSTTPATCALYPVWPLPPHKEAPRTGVPVDGEVDERFRFIAGMVNRMLNVHSVTEEQLDAKIRHMHAKGQLSAKATKHITKEHTKQGKWMPVPIPDWDQDGYGPSFSLRGIQFRGQRPRATSPALGMG